MTKYYYRLKADNTILDYTSFEDNANVPVFVKEQYQETERKIIQLANGSFAFEDEIDIEAEAQAQAAKEFAELKEKKHNAAGAAFAAKRDAIRFIKISDGNTYGFDCANEDITNFMANWKAAELDGQTEHKVWLDETTKGMVVMQSADFKTVFNIANKSQKEAYAWYGEIAAAIEAATSVEELESIVW